MSAASCPPDHQFGPADHVLERIVDFVRHPGDQLADGRQAFAVDQLIAQMPFLGDVALAPDDVGQRPSLVHAAPPRCWRPGTSSRRPVCATPFRASRPPVRTCISSSEGEIISRVMRSAARRFTSCSGVNPIARQNELFAYRQCPSGVSTRMRSWACSSTWARSWCGTSCLLHLGALSAAMRATRRDSTEIKVTAVERSRTLDSEVVRHDAPQAEVEEGDQRHRREDHPGARPVDFVRFGGRRVSLVLRPAQSTRPTERRRTAESRRSRRRSRCDTTRLISRLLSVSVAKPTAAPSASRR